MLDDPLLFNEQVNSALRVRDVIWSGILSDTELADLVLLDSRGQPVSQDAKIGLYDALFLCAADDLWPRTPLPWTHVVIAFGPKRKRVGHTLHAVGQTFKAEQLEVFAADLNEFDACVARLARSCQISPSQVLLVAHVLDLESVRDKSLISRWRQAGGTASRAADRLVVIEETCYRAFTYSRLAIELRLDKDLNNLFTRGLFLKELCGDLVRRLPEESLKAQRMWEEIVGGRRATVAEGQ